MSTLSGVTGTQTTTDSLIIDSMMPTDRVVHPSPHVLRLRPSNDLSLLPLEQSTLEREQAANAWQGAQIAPEDALRYRQEIDKADRGLLVARIMQRDLVAVPEHMTVGQLIDYLRDHQDLTQDFWEVFVVDPQHKPVGTCKLSWIILVNSALQVLRVWGFWR